MAQHTADAAALTDQVGALFRASYPSGPWPRAYQCYSLAVIISTVRATKLSYRNQFKEDNRSLRERRAVVEDMRRLIERQKNILKTQLAMVQLPGPLQDARNLEVLEAALKQAAPALLAPIDPHAGMRDKAWWHKAARVIAESAEAALLQAGHKKVSKQKHGNFVKVVSAALKLATGTDFEPETVAAVLNDKLSPTKLAG
jgi:hypothetical protein